MNKNIDGVGEVQAPSTPKEKIQNFWYHYKWHSLVAVFLVIAITVCSLQFCQRTKYDAYILYAGSKSIGRTAEDGDVAEIETVISALKRVSDDFDENGTVSVNFTSYYYLSPEEAKGEDVNDALLSSDAKALSGVFDHSEYYLVFISEAVYERYHKAGDDEIFVDLEEFKSHNPNAQYYAQNAIYLSSIGASDLPGFSSLPDDTLICIRYPSSIGGKSKEHKKYFENAKEILINILELN